MTRFIIVSLLSTCCLTLSAQTLTIDSAVRLAIEKHPSIAAARSQTARQKALKRAAVEIPKTEFSLMRGQYNSIVTDQNITIGQTIPFPLTIARQKKLAAEMVTSAQLNEDVTKNELAYRVRQTFNLLTYLDARRSILRRQDSLFENSLQAAEVQYRTGDIPLLTKTLAETQRMEIRNELEKNQDDIESARTTLQLLCQTNFTGITGKLENLIGGEANVGSPEHNPSQSLAEQQVKIASQEKKLEASRALPEIKISYFNQTLIGTQNINGQDVYFGSTKRFDGFQFGLSIPIWFPGYVNRAKSGNHAEEASRQDAATMRLHIANQLNSAKQQLAKNRNSLAYYRDSALGTARLLREQTRIAFANGEIDYSTLLLNLRQVLTIEEGYLITLYNINENLITIHYLHGNN